MVLYNAVIEYFIVCLDTLIYDIVKVIVVVIYSTVLYG